MNVDEESPHVEIETIVHERIPGNHVSSCVGVDGE